MRTDFAASSLKSRVLRALTDWPDSLPTRAVRVAFPIRKVVYSVVERQPIEIGLVERFVSQAVMEFGPLGAEEIASLLSLDTELIQRVAEGLSGESGALAMVGEKFAARPAGELPPHHVVTHDRAFAVSAIDGTLLPVNAVEVLGSGRIDANALRDDVGSRVPGTMSFHGKFMHVPHVDGIASLMSLVDGPPDVCRKYGLPLGLLSVGERRQEQEEEYWIEAVLFVGRDRCWIRPSSLLAIDLVHEPYDSRDFIKSACSDLRPGMCEPDPSLREVVDAASQSMADLAPQALASEAQLTLTCAKKHFNLARILGKEDARSGSELFRSDIWWHQRSGSIVKLRVGDVASARAAAAVRLHQRLTRNVTKVISSPATAWEQVVESVLKSCADGFVPPPLELKRAIADLREVNNNVLQRSLDAIEDSVARTE